MSYIESFNRPGRASVLIDGQYGSTGKGLAAAFIAQHSPIDIAITNAAPNAGHTTILEDGRKFVCYHLPTSGVICEDAFIYLDAGAIIDPPLLFQELEATGVDRDRVLIHPNAAVVTDEDKEYEAGATSGAAKIASTQKGVGRALARKIMREGVVAKMRDDLKKMVCFINPNSYLIDGKRVMIEVPQGASLSISSPFYPHCTSRQVSVGQALADANVHPHFLGSVLLTARTFPIRVGNIPTGNSGTCYSDQRELSWDEVGQPPEVTTVTGRVRRVFTFSNQQFADAYEDNHPTHVFLNFCNYLRNRREFNELVDRIKKAESDSHWSNPTYHMFGFGPSVNDIELNAVDAAMRLEGDRCI